MFNPFYTTSATENLGLGLSVVYHSIHSIMMGTIEVFNREEGGLQVILKIPNSDVKRRLG